MKDRAFLKSFKSSEQEGFDHVGEGAEQARDSEPRAQKLSARDSLNSPQRDGSSGSGRDHSGMSDRPRRLSAR
jgi:hypothetical protein